MNKLINRYRQSKDLQHLAENFISLTALKIFGYIFPLITLPYLARVIGVDKFGEIAFGVSTIIYLKTLVDFGFNYTSVRDIARSKADINKVSEIFSTTIVAKVCLMVLSLFLLVLCIYTIPTFYENRIILILTFLYIPGQIMFPDWFFQGMEQMKFITFLNLLSKVLFTGLVFLLIREKADYIFQPVLIAFGDFMSGIVAIGLIIKRFKVKFQIPSFQNIFTAMKGSWNMFVTLFFPNLYTNFSVILLRSYGGLVPTGIYSSGYKFIELADQLSLVLSRTFYPFLARRLDKHSLYVKISGTINVLAGLCLFLGADLIVKIFYTDDFADSSVVIKIMALSLIFLFLTNTYGTNYLVLIGKDHILRNIIIICSVLGFILSWIIVPKFSYLGVAITITSVRGIIGICTLYYAKKAKKTLRG